MTDATLSSAGALFQAANTMTQRILVESNSVWYVSAANHTSNTTDTVTSGAFGDATWAILNTSTWAVGTFDQSLSSDITSLGAFFGSGDLTKSTALTSLGGLQMYSLEYNAVPEPSSFALLFGGVAGLLVFRRRR
jgi:hypothetical protein